MKSVCGAHSVDTTSSGDSAATCINAHILCPLCGYDLWGLAEPRCPECGAQFESMQVLWRYERCEWPAPGLMRTLRTLYLHPLAFWDAPAVRFGRAPSIWCCLALVAVPAAIMSVLPALPTGGPMVLSQVVGQFTASFLIVCFLLLVLITAHAGLCWKLLPSGEGEHPDRRSTCIAVYSAAWLIPSVLLIAGTIVCSAFAGIGRGSLPRSATAIFGVAEFVTAGLWAATLYKGGHVLSRGKHTTAIWCVLTNPFWILFVLPALLR